MHPAIYAVIVAATCLLIMSPCRRRRGQSTPWLPLSQKRVPDYFKLSGISPPTPLYDFNVDKAKARPYRPFRWQYHQTMGLKRLEPDWWLELESTYRDRIAQRKALYAEHGEKVLRCLPGHEAACKELMFMVIQFLCARYPKQFYFHDASGRFKNRILDIKCDTESVDPLVFLLEHVPEDFILTSADEKTGLYHMRAGVVCSAMGWNISDKIGKPMHEIHGPVPDYDKIKPSIDRFFSKLPCDKPIQRGSWGLEIGQPLFLQPDDPTFASRETQSPTLAVEDIHLRVDWQTLRRLPLSKYILFNYKALFTPLTQFRHEPYIPKLVAKVLREGKRNMLDYKGTDHIKHKALPALEMWAKEQEEEGHVPKDWQERTLDEDPFFPGWEATR